jgi:hypothetical protein
MLGTSLQLCRSELSDDAAAMAMQQLRENKMSTPFSTNNVR